MMGKKFTSSQETNKSGNPMLAMLSYAPPLYLFEAYIFEGG